MLRCIAKSQSKQSSFCVVNLWKQAIKKSCFFCFLYFFMVFPINYIIVIVNRIIEAIGFIIFPELHTKIHALPGEQLSCYIKIL